jgi:class 3 adenylate cyclase
MNYVVLLVICAKWRSNDLSLHFGAGIASGYTTIGGMGAEGFWDDTIVGTTTNMASRLCSAATEGQILVSKTFMSNIEEDIHAEPIGALNLKGLHQAVTAYNVLSVK